MAKQERERSLYPGLEERSSLSSSENPSELPSQETISAKFDQEANPKKGKPISRRGFVVLGLKGLALGGLGGGIGGIKIGRGIEINRHSSGTLEEQLKEKEKEVGQLKKENEALRGKNSDCGRTVTNLRIEEAKEDVAELAEDAKQGAEVLKLKGESLVWKVRLAIEEKVRGAILTDAQDQIMLGLSFSSGAFLNRVEKDCQDLVNFLDGVKKVIKSTKEGIVWVKDLIECGDELAGVVDQGLGLVSKVVGWASEVVEKAYGTKTERIIDSLLDSLGKRFPKVKELREEIEEAVKKVEDEWPKQIIKRQAKRKEEKEEWKETQKKWIEGSEWAPFEPAVATIQSLAKGVGEIAAGLREKIGQNEKLVEDRIKNRQISVQAEKREIILPVSWEERLRNNQLISQSEIDQLAAGVYEEIGHEISTGNKIDPIDISQNAP